MTASGEPEAEIIPTLKDLAVEARALQPVGQGSSSDMLHHRRFAYATQMPGTATFWKRCGEATAEDG